jgi:hypothetical protein
MTASEKLPGSNPKWFKNLDAFGEIGITYNIQQIKGKLDNRGILVCVLAIQKIMNPMFMCPLI